ncbi:MAG: DUF2281 domain-containing protein [Oculatellaceae cyanobacterium bins.114]|nr:DUF2281 domain-containing protein [Oculatellaceae cyanobacterium bins.114]
MTQTAIIHNIEKILKTLPEPLQIEALHYIEYLSSQYVHQDATQKSRSTEDGIIESPEEEIPKKRGGFGVWQGKISMADDFDAPLEEFEEYM